MPEDISLVKSHLRRQCRVRRRKIFEAHPQAGEALASHFQKNLNIAQTQIVAGYWPIQGEIDPRPLMQRLSDAGVDLVLPVTGDTGQPLLFRSWYPGDQLAAGRFGTSEPANDRMPMTPNLLLVPMLAFDRQGWRLGYGGGYYDATISALRPNGVMTVGLAFSGQEIDSVPHQTHDQRLDWIVTDNEAVRIA